ncbi:MAG: LamG-like jellyroll fold domain-containing protein [Bacteroidia bacterium]
MDGTDQYVEIPYNASLNPTTTFSIECWAKIEGGAGTWRSPITSREVPGASNSRGYLLYAGTDDNWQFWTGSTGNNFSTLNSNVPVTNEWTHVAGTFDGSTLRIYINGILANSSAGTYTANPSRPLRIGAGATEGTPLFYFSGKIDEVRIWSDVRSQAEIQANMHKELEGSESNLVAYYSMSDGSGTTLTDNSSNTNNGTLTNSPTWKTSGALAGPRMALDFDGSDDHVNMGDVLENLGTVTMEAWVYWRGSAEAFSEIFTKNLINSFSITSTNNLHINFGDGSSWNAGVNSAKTIPTGTWTHLAATRDGDGLVKLYINGVLDANTATLSATGQNSDFRSIGCKYISSNTAIVGPFSGIIDEVRLWSSVRSEAEIRAYKDRTLEGNESNLVGYFRFDQQADAGNTTVYDYSSNGNNGTLTNMTPASDWVEATPFNTWIGSENSDWSNADNWGNASVPSTEDVGIFNWAGSNLPTSSNISARNFYLDAGITFSHSGNLTLSGDYYNAGVFTTTGTVTFSGTAAQAIRGTGTSTFGTMTINNSAGVTMEQDITTSTSLTLTSGALSIGANTLTINGAVSQTSGTLTGGSSSNITIGGAGASTSLSAVTLNNLTLNRANGVTLGGSVTVNGALGLTAGILDLNANTLTMGSAASVSGSPGNSSHIDARTGSLRKDYSGADAFLFPVGDGTVYSPITLNFTSGSFSTGYATVGLAASKHLNNNSTTDYISRYWTVSSSGISGFSCNVSAQYDDNDINGTESNIHGGKYSGGSWTDLGAVSTGSNLITGTVTGFSDFTGGEADAFPVEWLSFTGKPEEKTVLLEWITATELNTHFFAIERSEDQQSWNNLGKVTAAGTSSKPENYQFTDTQPIPGLAYYRLRQVDFDGKYQYSPTIAVNLYEGIISVYPNPVEDQMFVTISDNHPYELILSDIHGKFIMRRVVTPGTHPVSLAGLSPGIYYINIRNRFSRDYRQTVIKK